MLTPEENKLLTPVGPGTPMGELLRQFWMPVLLSEELPAPDCPPVPVRLLGEDLVAFRDTRGRLGLLAAHCPHRLADLFYARNEECGLRCVYHGWKFDVEGRCVDMPTETPESSFRDKVRAKAYAMVEAGGAIWAYMGPAPVPELPRLPVTRVPDGYGFAMKRLQESNFVQAIEGGIDSAHTRFLHTTLEFYNRSDAYLDSLGPLRERFDMDPNSLNANELDALFRTADKAPRVMAQRTTYGLAIGARASLDQYYYWRFNQFMMPFYTIPPRAPGGHAFVPIDDENTWVFTFAVQTNKPFSAADVRTLRMGRVIEGPYGAPVDENFYPLANKGNRFLIDRDLQRRYNFTGIIGGGNQDSAMQASMGPVVDRSEEHLGVTDVGIIEMRRLLLQSVRDLMEGTEPAEARNAAAYEGVRGVSFVRPKDVPPADCVDEVMRRIHTTGQQIEHLRDGQTARAPA
jgi:phthalate 4,5-dioxygenase